MGKTGPPSVVFLVVFNILFIILQKDVLIMPTEISRYPYQSNYESDNYNTSLLVVTSVQYNDSSSIGKIWNFAIPISFATFVTLTILLMCLAGKCYNGCLKRRRRDDMPVTTKYRVAMSNKLMLDLENGTLDPKDMPCLHCKFIEMGEMACYTKTCPECGRPPPVDMGSPSPRLLPKCKSQCVGGDKNQLESDGDAPYFQFPPNEKEFDNICATSETPTSSSK